MNKLHQLGEEYAQLLILHSLDCISTSDDEGNIVSFNPAAVNTFGYTLEELQSLDYKEMYATEEEFERVNGIMIRNGQYIGEVLNKRKNGEVFTSYLSANTLFNSDGKFVGIMGVSRDITNYKKVLEEIEEKNITLENSLTYAQRILNATYPTDDSISQLFPDHFVLFEAKDSISGDFYLVEQIKTRKEEDVIVFVVGDCTGHGIPGGILSILCNNLVKQSLHLGNIHNANEALEWIREQLILTFSHNSDEPINDGMDIGLGIIRPQSNTLEYAGANISLVIIRDEEMIQVHGDRQHVGYSESMIAFGSQVIDIQPGDQIYLSTDGYFDQFGGPKNKKLLRKKFLDLLNQIHHMDMNKQAVWLKNYFLEWKGTNTQTDDICVLGFTYDK